MEVSGRHHAPAALPPGYKIGTHYTGIYLGSIIGLDVFGDEENSDKDSDSGPSITYAGLSYAGKRSLERN
jgi:hypothetical protein